MSNSKLHTDDFKTLFESNQIPNLPLEMEDKIMAGIELQALRNKRKAPQWLSTNLIIFSTSLFLLVVLAVIQFTLDFQFALVNDISLMLMFSSVIFGILWLVQLAEGLLMQKLARSAF